MVVRGQRRNCNTPPRKRRQEQATRWNQGLRRQITRFRFGDNRKATMQNLAIPTNGTGISDRYETRGGHARAPRPLQETRRHQERHDRARRQEEQVYHCRVVLAHRPLHRDHQVGLREGETAGAPRQTVRWRRCRLSGRRLGG